MVQSSQEILSEPQRVVTWDRVAIYMLWVTPVTRPQLLTQNPLAQPPGVVFLAETPRGHSAPARTHLVVGDSPPHAPRWPLGPWFGKLFLAVSSPLPQGGLSRAIWI